MEGVYIQIFSWRKKVTSFIINRRHNCISTLKDENDTWIYDDQVILEVIAKIYKSLNKAQDFVNSG